MDLFDILLNAGVITGAIVAYLIFFKRSAPIKFDGPYRKPAWNYQFRLFNAKFAVKRWKSNRSKAKVEELPRLEQIDGWDCVTIRSSDPDGTTVYLAIRKWCGRQALAEVTLHLKLADGTTYKLPQHPDTAIGPWEDIADGWSANGLKILVLEPQARLRILYNGLLTNVATNTTQHVRFNFLWASAARVIQHPEDWSDELAAQALALEAWRDDKWPATLGRWDDGSWMQWGTVQGRLQSFDSSGKVDQSVYLQTRGVRERSWAPHAYRGLRRTITITAAARDGTAVQLRGFSYKDVLTLGFHGCVRFPNFAVHSITGTDLVMAQFCEHPDGIPKIHKMNVSTKNREISVVLRMNEDGGRLLSGVPYQHGVVYRTLHVDIDGERGTGLLELGYEPTVISDLPYELPPAPVLRWLSEREAGEVGYCLSFEDRAAACAGYVGGKGASLALMASLQHEQGYKVPPGYCLTTRAMEKHLETNPHLLIAIKEIEAATENYDEKIFKEKCNKAVELFASTEITGDVKEAILAHLKDLRKKALEQGLGPELRFAVRSSAVGEDSEALSAAGQNETFLGCVSDEDVLRGVQKCWGSMFAFTSAHYRRQNGQACMCGGGVVVQALVAARAAGVMFTRHPDNGDPARLLLTANYGLGESVVSGSVEPDTIIISRGKELTVAKIELGSKSQRVTASGDGVTVEEVSESERKTPCLTMSETLRLAHIGVMQERLWGAGRDIEWAVCKDHIYLLQARPITSLERWTEEELLHELDFPVMSDDELLTFANTGEVMPKPLTALTYDVVIEPLTQAINRVMFGTNGDGYDKSIVISHNRCAISLYNSVYRHAPKSIDLTIRMLEMSVHGHKVADEQILNVALHRRPHSRISTLRAMLYTAKYLMMSKGCMDDTIKLVKNMNIDTDTNDPLKLLEAIMNVDDKISQCSLNHGYTSSASAASQSVAMMILVEGASDFTAEQCSEINTLLSAGGVLSAEVPQELSKLANQLESSGKAEEFRALDPKEAMDWLENNLPDVYKNVCTFLEQHGYRAIMEFDLSTKPWVLQPDEMIKILQNMRASKEVNHIAKSDTEVIASLKTPKKSSTRRTLRWLLALCRRMVRNREATKAQLILAIHKVRVVALQLGQVLVRQWYLPDADLVFHFRIQELRDYIKTRDPALLKKACSRYQYYPSWCKLKFAEIHKGWIKPVETREPMVTADDVRIEATSVCGGEVVARACVVKDLSEIGQLQQGDILITHSTDIGWSPYFPLLAGIVTELGGLISHGAVIARECGLPCIVGATDATYMFKTGDMVRLSSTKGVLERVKVEQETVNDDNQIEL